MFVPLGLVHLVASVENLLLEHEGSELVEAFALHGLAEHSVVGAASGNGFLRGRYHHNVQAFLGGGHGGHEPCGTGAHHHKVGLDGFGDGILGDGLRRNLEGPFLLGGLGGLGACAGRTLRCAAALGFGGAVAPSILGALGAQPARALPATMAPEASAPFKKERRPIALLVMSSPSCWLSQWSSCRH